ncbi:putative lactoylglutathione lyase [Chryseobacterium sp. H1D6B]|uniref:VOC family protein n=1 Tax=Chryseobacterium sp. H1D6B TaxID=2940588 RepID=UPI0015C7DA69|nr:VOC family protein [Chryseobacterium sp. H1D6B]MDH6254267.1 putative lactoylglutathione lyase [Chryseobacterium sp. H1D6B]
MKINQIYVNLPVKDVAKTRTFWTKLGFAVNEQFSNENAVSIVLNEQSIFVMFLKEEFFKTFTNRPLAKGDTTQVLLAIGTDSREDLDYIIQTAVENGGSKYSEPQDNGWMYQSAFADPDGHQWEVMFADMSQFPQQ